MTKERKVNTTIPVIFQNVQEHKADDTRFTSVKIWLMHTGKNFNGSYFSKEAVEKAVPTLANTPILSLIEEDLDGNKDFTDHGIELKRTEGDVKLIHTTSAIGVIPENNNARWEKRVTDNGEEKEYIVIDALLWNKWDEPIDIMKRKGFTSQSMELADDFTGHWNEETELFHFEDFKFFGACLLGSGVEPAMENSTAEIMFSKNENIQATIEQKLQEFQALFTSKGGNSVSEEKKDELQEEVKVEDVKETEEKKDVETEAVEPVSEPSKEDENKDVKEDVEQPQDDENKQDEAEQAIAKAELEYQKLLDSHKDLAYDFSLLEKEISDLKAYKRNREEQDVQAKFDGQLSKDEIEKVFADMKDKPVEEIEIKLFALVGQKSFSKKKKTVDADIVSAPVLANFQEEKKDSPYGNLFD